MRNKRGNQPKNYYNQQVSRNNYQDYEETEALNNSCETKNEKFIRLAEGRVENLLDWLRKLDNLSNRGNYDYTDDQVEQMFSRIENDLAEVKSHFLSPEKEPIKFRFR